MCIINFQWSDHEKYPLIIAANRDEQYDRPTAKAHYWDDHPQILAGRDLKEKGTWLGITKSGRFAALTNYRDPKTMYKTFEKSRGDLVKNFLCSKGTPKEYLQKVHANHEKYNGFNLIVGTLKELYYYNNIENNIEQIKHGTYSLSNRFLHTKWPKTIRGKNKLKKITKSYETIQPSHLYPLLMDDQRVDDAYLPDTGIGLTLERALSPIFIQTDNYGTRSSTVLLIDRNNNVTFSERTYHKGKITDEVNFQLTIS